MRSPPKPLDPGALSGRRILVVEDDYFLAEDLRQELVAHRAEVLGPVPSLAEALALVDQVGALDAAVLDVHVGDGTIYPLAELLRNRDIRFVFATALGRAELPRAWDEVPCHEKPLDMSLLLRSLAEV